MRVRSLLLALAFTLAAMSAGAAPADAQAPGVTIVVTNSSDGAGAACPHATLCTVRKAIETANATPGDGLVTITFSTTVFPRVTPTTIAVATTKLPTVTRNSVTIDGSAAGVILDGAAVPPESAGIAATGSGFTLYGLGIWRFNGECVVAAGAGAVIGGDPATGRGNRLSACTVGLLIRGAGAKVAGNLIGFEPASNLSAPITGVGIVIQESSATIGGEALAPAFRNIIGNTPTAIRIGPAVAPAAPAYANIEIARNLIGVDPAGAPAPVGVAIDIRPNAKNSAILLNEVRNASGAGISLAPDEGAATISGITVRKNVFVGVAGLPIDHKGDGVLNPNDEGDTDSGPNGLLNRPTILKATQARVTGTAGAGCIGCKVELYIAVHQPGALTDGTLTPVPIAQAIADATGGFAFEAAPVTPGQWVATTVIDGGGNSSEFSPSVRVGSGTIQCGNVSLQAGWNMAGFFAAGVQLGATFPGDATAAVQAVYQLQPDGSYLRWLRDTPIGRTLTALESGQAYWFLADGPVTLSSGFTLATPPPLQLLAGWNDIVYFGAGADVRDAFAPIRDTISALHTYAAGGAAQGAWASWGTAGIPEWARAFSTVQSCGAYRIAVPQAVVLDLLQP